jgi:hypothetical protein
MEKSEGASQLLYEDPGQNDASPLKEHSLDASQEEEDKVLE